MAIFDELEARAANATTAKRGQTQRNGDARPAAKQWLNVGYEDGEGKFISLPLGLAIDTMEPAEEKGSSIEWLEFVAARNELLAEMQKKGDQLAEGQELDLPLIVRLRKVNNKVEVDAETRERIRAQSPLANM